MKNHPYLIQSNTPPYNTLKSLKQHHKVIITSMKGIGVSGGQRDAKTSNSEFWADPLSQLRPQVDELCTQVTFGSIQRHLRWHLRPQMLRLRGRVPVLVRNGLFGVFLCNEWSMIITKLILA